MPVIFDAPVYAHRLSTAAELAHSQGLAGLIIGTGPELAYLTGSTISSHERLTALVIPAQGTPQLVVPATDLGELAHSAVPELEIEIRGWVDGDRPHSLAVESLPTSGAVALGSSLTTIHVLTLQQLLPGRSTVPAATTLADLFMVKDPAEISQLKRAGEAIDAVHQQVPGLLLPGHTERQVADTLAKLILVEHEVVDFVIVGSGPNGADPHHSYSDRVLESGDVVVVDLGGTLDTGYHSDETRTYIVGGPEAATAKAREAYEVLFNAHAAAVAAVAPGVSAADLDAAARAVITEAGYGDYFIHRTGHGIGLSTHEEPYLMAGNNLPVEPGMCFSVEPGIYLPGEWGMRLEDIVTVTSSGAEYLSYQHRELR
ncbi:M24 family metallopeptidase [Corynebacterium alimapuense]|uniref:Peptidase M24 family protein n=1 Tax=Corynebacterium alimapuense TaxID=1576874 RepID=A0A3M8KAZ9_9CORY|nr:Xaa-Pro peptidase family protein [Corynebacterium alimapuense]RNE49724.1 peptidase M24 family protein [Corynebacterium alimapuense]